MRAFQEFYDERHRDGCTYCGRPSAETRDHVPARVFLDRPLPENLPVVPCCPRCNNRKSVHEQYLACLIDCVVTGSAEPCEQKRPTVKATLERSSGLRADLASRMKSDESGTAVMQVPLRRTRHILKLLAMGHLKFELAERVVYGSVQLAFSPLHLMSAEQRNEFEQGATGGFATYPEIGSRAFIRMFEDAEWPWTIVQPGRYRYRVDHDAGPEVRFVLSEYLACRAWVEEDESDTWHFAP